MIVNLGVPFVDSRVEDLSFVPRVESSPVLDSIEIPLRAGLLSLRLLGASHQAVVTFPDGSHYAETLACLPGAVRPVPEHFGARAGGWQFEFSCQVMTVTNTWLDDYCDRLRRRASADTVLLGVFPSEDNALTYLDVSSRRDGWHTVHCYPESKSVVRTRTTLTPTANAEPISIPGEQDEK